LGLLPQSSVAKVSLLSKAELFPGSDPPLRLSQRVFFLWLLAAMTKFGHTA
jgi:hypothetical protein